MGALGKIHGRIASENIGGGGKRKKMLNGKTTDGAGYQGEKTGQGKQNGLNRNEMEERVRSTTELNLSEERRFDWDTG